VGALAAVAVVAVAVKEKISHDAVDHAVSSSPQGYEMGEPLSDVRSINKCDHNDAGQNSSQF
jgi:hypothetical protein